MTTQEFFSAIAALSGLTFVVAGMLGTGASLTVAQVLEPLKNRRLVIMALLANFVLVPLLAYLITVVLPLDEPLKIGLIVLACVAGAPFLVKEVQASRGGPPDRRRPDVPADGRDHRLRAARPAAAPARRRRERLGHRQVADRDHAHPHGPRPPLPGALPRGRGALGAATQQGLRPRPAHPARNGGRHQRRQHHRARRAPGASSR